MHSLQKRRARLEILFPCSQDGAGGTFSIRALHVVALEGPIHTAVLQRRQVFFLNRKAHLLLAYDNCESWKSEVSGVTSGLPENMIYSQQDNFGDYWRQIRMQTRTVSGLEAESWKQPKQTGNWLSENVLLHANEG